MRGFGKVGRPRRTTRTHLDDVVHADDLLDGLLVREHGTDQIAHVSDQPEIESNR